MKLSLKLHLKSQNLRRVEFCEIELVTVKTALPKKINSNPVMSPQLRRSKRERKIPGKFKDFILDKSKVFSVNDISQIDLIDDDPADSCFNVAPSSHPNEH
jgi:hypothetical protein